MMPAKLGTRQRWAVVAAVLLAIFLFCQSSPRADEGAAGSAAAVPEGSAVSGAQGVPPPAADSGAAVWENSAKGETAQAAPGANPEETAAAAQPQGEADKMPPAVETRPQEPPPPEVAAESKPATQPAAAPPPSGPEFKIAGLAVGMDMNAAKAVFDQILGFESTAVETPIGNRIQFDGGGYAKLTGDGTSRVARMEFGQVFVDAVFEVEGLKPQEFAKKFAEIYAIEMDLDVTRRHPVWQYTNPAGVTVTISSSDSDDKTLVIEKK